MTEIRALNRSEVVGAKNIPLIFDRPSSLIRGQNHFQFVLHCIYLREEDGTWWAKVSYQPLDSSTPITQESKIHRWENKLDPQDVRLCVEVLTYKGCEDRDVYPGSFFRYPDKEHEYVSLFDQKLNVD